VVLLVGCAVPCGASSGLRSPLWCFWGVLEAPCGTCSGLWSPVTRNPCARRLFRCDAGSASASAVGWGGASAARSAFESAAGLVHRWGPLSALWWAPVSRSAVGSGSMWGGRKGAGSAGQGGLACASGWSRVRRKVGWTIRHLAPGVGPGDAVSNSPTSSETPARDRQIFGRGWTSRVTDATAEMNVPGA